MPQIIGILLWALVPGFIARSKGRSFLGYYFLSLLITPIVTMIITLCLSNLKKQSQVNQIQTESPKIKICKCGKCGTKREDNVEPCSVCGSTMIKFEYIESEKVSEDNAENSIPQDIDDRKKCEMCDQLSENLVSTKIVDSMGTRYRKLCPNCIVKYNAEPIVSSNKENKLCKSQNKPMFCRICGSELIADSLFCSKCGTKVDVVDEN